MANAVMRRESRVNWVRRVAALLGIFASTCATVFGRRSATARAQPAAQVRHAVDYPARPKFDEGRPATGHAHLVQGRGREPEISCGLIGGEVGGSFRNVVPVHVFPRGG